MWWKIALAAMIIVALCVVVIVTTQARRLDALHKKILTSRAALENALHARARTAINVAQSGVLDMAGSVVLANAAKECGDSAGYDLVADGLNIVDDVKFEPVGRADGSFIQHDRLALESELSRVLRYTVDELEDEDIVGHEQLLERLAQARQSVRMTRRFHNIHVVGAQRIRRQLLARIFRTYGNASWPQTVDLDDE
ncbi:hypothetical protein [Arcanobacterium buesumense]|uniref:NUDIX hydrolase n=1 Tax=Arcanobacterium buesumense TaxID=2722751 RepID=A0A6H2EKK3_9ACTO|nr:hypothetical protein [Arcanobacterium buesumense]QJC21724.1 hypothetical protein HC352_03870 [Arcanobacterium buesumense]